ncbi:MAG: hypothetical protein BMS9Abin05_2316 [Rhodothermia bacterium]|nr:MAG: hypothetical protein BMS9Abin05_2316 [Rhodothermia bacterium]
MEKNKIIPALVGLLVLLVLIAYATGTFDRAPSTVDVPKFEIQVGEIDQIEVSSTEFNIHVQKVNGLWQVLEPIAWMADSVSINAFTESLADFELESVVSRNPARYGRYGVDSTASLLTLTSGDEVQKMTVASEGSDFMTVYVRLEGDERVFVGRPRLSIPTDADRWRDKMIATIPSQILTAANVTSPDNSFSLSKGDTGWRLSVDGRETAADSVAVERYLRNFNRFRADGFISTPPQEDADQHVVELVLSTGESMTFTFTELENELALDYSGQPRATFKLFSSRKNTLIPDPTIFSSE